MKALFLGIGLWAALSGVGRSEPLDFNSELLQILDEMPTGGSWEGSQRATEALQSAVGIEAGRLRAYPERWMPSYCTGAVYLALVRALERKQDAGQLSFSQAQMEALLARRQLDGTDFWGWFNSNGPGVARLVWKLGIGRNFTRFEQARPGDLVKFWWTRAIGRRESGHQVIFLGEWRKTDGTRMVKFWSSQKSSTPAGYAIHSVTRASIKHAIFSRISDLSGLMRAPLLGTDAYLAAMLTRASSISEAKRMSGIPTHEMNQPDSAAGDLESAPLTSPRTSP